MARNIEPRKQGRQARAKATQDAIIEATARFLEQGGVAGLTTNRIAERAGVSIGSLYQYFPNKDAILVALIRRERARLLADVAAIVQRETDPQAQLAALIGAGLHHQFARPKLALQLEYIETTLDIGREAQETTQNLAALIFKIVKARAPQADQAIARDVVAICQALINTAAMAGETDLTVLEKRVLKAVEGYLA